MPEGIDPAYVAYLNNFASGYYGEPAEEDWYEEDDEYDDYEYEDEDDEVPEVVYVDEETGREYGGEELAQLAQALDAREDMQSWFYAAERLSARLGRKLTAREGQGIGERLHLHWDGEGDPLDAVQAAYDSYYRESDAKPPDNPAELFNELMTDAEGPWQPTTTPGETPGQEPARGQSKGDEINQRLAEDGAG